MVTDLDMLTRRFLQWSQGILTFDLHLVEETAVEYPVIVATDGNIVHLRVDLQQTTNQISSPPTCVHVQPPPTLPPERRVEEKVQLATLHESSLTEGYCLGYALYTNTRYHGNLVWWHKDKPTTNSFCSIG